MKTYIVWNSKGNEVGYIRSNNHNNAEITAQKMFGDKTTVEYTELGPAFDHCKGFFTNNDAKY
jgi:hypothetical protein